MDLHCRNVVELLSAAVDGELAPDLRFQVDSHLNICSQCSHEYELERMTKHFVRKTLPSVQAPEALKNNILRQIARERAAIASDIPLSNTLTWTSKPNFYLAFGSVAAVLLFLLIPSNSRHVHTQPQDANIIHQTYNNYDGVLDGKLTPEVASDDPRVVQAFFQSNVSFPVNVPRMKQFKLMGGRCSDYSHECVAHLLYQHEKDVIYVYQLQRRDLYSQDGLQLPQNVMAELIRTGWYFENFMPNCSLAIWLTDSTICSAISDMPKDRLLASLKGNE